MIERVIEYLANAVWQLPLLALAAWWLLRAVRVGPLAQHRVWLVVLGLGVLFPLARVRPTVTVAPAKVAVASGGAVRNTDALPVRANVAKDGVSWLCRRNVQVSAGAARWLAGIYFAVAFLGAMRLLRGWMAARRLVREAGPLAEDASAIHEAVTACGVGLGNEMPRVLVSAELSSPAIVGAWAPVLLVPEAFCDCGHEDIKAALLHEMAHIRRRDYAANVLCEMAAVPLVWHPVMHAVQRRIRSTREMVCDAMAAREMGSAMVYARSLLDLAGRALDGGAGIAPLSVGLFTNNNLEERVMQLTETKQTAGARTRLVRGMSAAVGVAVVLGFAAMVHLTPAMAQTAASTTVTQATGVPSETQASATAAIGAQTMSTDTASGDGLSATSQAANPDRQPTIGQSTPPEESTTTATGHGMAFTTGRSEATGASRSEAVAMAKGVGATVESKEGYSKHEWTTEDGEPFQMMNREKAEPTIEERKRYEAEFAQRQAEINKQMDSAQAQMDSAEFKQQMAKINSPEFKQQMAAQMKEMKKQMAAAKVDSKEIQRQVAAAQRTMNSPEIQKQMAELSSGKIQAEVEAQMATMKAQIDATVNAEVQKARLRETEEQLKEAQKQLEETQKELQAERLKQKDIPDKPE